MNPQSKAPPHGIPGDSRGEHALDRLHPIPRSEGRSRLHLESLPFSGVDIWTSYELSWLDLAGKPVVAIGEFRFPATSPNIVESKSLKLYLNSFSERRYESVEALRSALRDDLGQVSGADVEVRIEEVSPADPRPPGTLPGNCMDGIPVEISTYDLDPSLLSDSAEPDLHVSETLHSHLFKSNCPVTAQPDWASIMIRYRGAKIRADRLLSYLISYRNHSEFHEQCVERVFVDIQRYCRPEALTVYARYTRRGGLDINPFRSDFEEAPDNVPLLRQ